MTQEELDALPDPVRVIIEQIERLAEDLMMEIGPMRSASLMQTIAVHLQCAKVVE